MKLFFVRHGETVDNVAGVYAGIRDSALTNHGFQQAQRLGQHFNAASVKFTHIFSSHLQRAFKTGEAIRAAQADFSTPTGLEDIAADAEKPLVGEEGLKVIQLPLLVEQDFGYYEGKPFYARSKGSGTSGKDAHHEEHKNDPGFVDVESKESMAKRSDIFLDEHLLPLLQTQIQESEHVVAIVSHGILLGNLWRCLLRRLPPKSVQYTPEVRARNPGRTVLEHLGGWSNTGYLELDIKQSRSAVVSEVALAESTSITARSSDDQAAGEPVVTEEDTSVPLERPFEPEPLMSPAIARTGEISSEEQPVNCLTQLASASPQKMLEGYTITIMAINGQDHLKGLKRTRGGIGRSRHDEGQKTIDSFFKQRKISTLSGKGASEKRLKTNATQQSSRGEQPRDVEGHEMEQQVALGRLQITQSEAVLQ